MKTEEEIKLLTLSIEELRRMHDEVCDNYTHAKNKILAFLAGELAFLSYLYSGGDLFIPPQLYGEIIYFIGLALLITSLALLFIAVQPVSWVIPTETNIHEKNNHESYIDFVRYVKNQYVIAVRSNNNHCNYKHKLLNMAFYLLVIGAILLLVVKIFGT